MTLYSTEFHFASEDGSRAACMGPSTALIPSSGIVRITDAWARIWHAPPDACEAEQYSKCLARVGFDSVAEEMVKFKRNCQQRMVPKAFDRARAEHGISCLNSMFFEYSDVIDGWHFPGPDS
jgi:hypothetical protein